jgi:hypothetical protein
MPKPITKEEYEEFQAWKKSQTDNKEKPEIDANKEDTLDNIDFSEFEEKWECLCGYKAKEKFEICPNCLKEVEW